MEERRDFCMLIPFPFYNGYFGSSELGPEGCELVRLLVVNSVERVLECVVH